VDVSPLRLWKSIAGFRHRDFRSEFFTGVYMARYRTPQRVDATYPCDISVVCILEGLMQTFSFPGCNSNRHNRQHRDTQDCFRVLSLVHPVQEVRLLLAKELLLSTLVLEVMNI
jgi:hypothetical protein